MIGMNMRKYISAAAAFLFSAAALPLFSAAGPAEEPVEITDLTEFNAGLEKMTSSVNSIDSRFEQRKYMDVLQRDVEVLYDLIVVAHFADEFVRDHLGITV